MAMYVPVCYLLLSSWHWTLIMSQDCRICHMQAHPSLHSADTIHRLRRHVRNTSWAIVNSHEAAETVCGWLSISGA